MSDKDFFATVLPENIIDNANDVWGMDNGFKNKRWEMRERKNKLKNNDKKIIDSNSNDNNFDRYIPHRNNNINIKKQNFEMNKNNINDKKDDEFKSCLKSSLLNKNIINSNNNDNNILTYKDKPPISYSGYINNLSIIYKKKIDITNKNKWAYNNNTKIKKRFIATKAEKILDAPELKDNFYVNILDWNINNIISIALGTVVYLFDCTTSNINILYDTNNANNFITSVKWTNNGNHLGIGLNNGNVLLYDVKKNKKLRTIKTHNDRVGSLAWNKYILSLGSKTSKISNHDVRIRDHLLSIINDHEQEICGLKWDNNGKYLCSGGNDNKCFVYDYNNINNDECIPLYSFNDSNSAVKAIAFCPWDTNLLSTGGGTGDRNIRLYNLKNGELIKEIDSNSQVCSLIFNPFDKELLSSHGFSKYQLSIWKYPNMIKTHDLIGHQSRVLHTSLSPNGNIVCSAAADETLRFWNVFQNPKNLNNNINKNIDTINITKQSKLYSKIR